MEETKSVKEVLEDVVNMLSGIKVPMSEIDAIGIPIARSINGIKACINAMVEDNVQEPPKKEESMPEILPEEESKE